MSQNYYHFYIEVVRSSNDWSLLNIQSFEYQGYMSICVINKYICPHDSVHFKTICISLNLKHPPPIKFTFICTLFPTYFPLSLYLVSLLAFSLPLPQAYLYPYMQSQLTFGLAFSLTVTIMFIFILPFELSLSLTGPAYIHTLSNLGPHSTLQSRLQNKNMALYICQAVLPAQEILP